MAAILLKLFGLALRTAAKPLGYQFQGWALEHPSFRKGAVNFAQFLHRIEVRISRGAEGKEGKAFVGAITDERALEMASKVVSEGFVFTVGAGVVIWEYHRSKLRDMEKASLEELTRKELIDQASRERERLEAVNLRQTQLIEGLVHRVDELEVQIQEYCKEVPLTRPWWTPWKSS